MVAPKVKNIPWSELKGFGGTLVPNHSSGMTWRLEGDAGNPIEVPSNPVDSTWGLDAHDWTFRADFVFDALHGAGIPVPPAFAAEYFRFPADWVRPANPFDNPGEQAPDVDDPSEQSPDFEAPSNPNQPPDFEAPPNPDQPPDLEAPPNPEQPPDFEAPDPPGPRGDHGPGER